MTVTDRDGRSLRVRASCNGACVGWLLLVFGCTVDDDIVARRVQATMTGGNGSGGVMAAGAGADSGGAGADSGGTGAGSGGAGAGSGGTGVEDCPAPPIVSAVQGGGLVCSGWAARRSFSQALCTCGNVSVPDVITSAASDSSLHDERDPRGSAAVSIGGDTSDSDYLRVEGTLTVAGESTVRSSGGFDVEGDLRLMGPAPAAGPIFVGRDAWLLGETHSLSLAYVERDLYLGPNASLTSLGAVLVLGQVVEQPFTLAPPCPCSPDDLLDVPGIVQQGMVENDNARVGLAFDALDASGTTQALTLDCGRYALSRVEPGRAVSLRITGRVALFVDSAVTLDSNFVLELAPGAELDWFIRGPLSIAPGARLGDSSRAGALRMYTTEAGPVSLPGTEDLAVNLYAPRMDASVEGSGDVYGSLFVATVTVADSLFLHYDRAVAYADADCALPPPTVCTACDQCSSGQACVAGSCGACSNDGDCCFPLVCDQARCLPLAAD